MDRWIPISEVDHQDGEQVQLWARHARVSAWSWSAERHRWERDGAEGLHWAEGEYGPTHFCAMADPPRTETSLVYRHAAERSPCPN